MILTDKLYLPEKTVDFDHVWYIDLGGEGIYVFWRGELREYVEVYNDTYGNIDREYIYINDHIIHLDNLTEVN